MSTSSNSSSPSSPAASRFLFAPLSPTLRLAHAPSFYDITTWPDDPMQVAHQWYVDGELAYAAAAHEQVHWPNTMQIATIAPDSGFPRVRTVLLKGLVPSGLIFFTNYRSAKSLELAAQPACAINMYWKTMERQMRVEGVAQHTSDEISRDYFHSRPLPSQVSGIVSPQSSHIDDRSKLENAYVDKVQNIAQQLEKHTNKQAVENIVAPLSNTQDSHEAHQRALKVLDQFDGDAALRPLVHAVVQRPSNWGGWLIKPHKIEFWCDGKYRLHSRIVYTKQQDGTWTKEFLAP